MFGTVIRTFSLRFDSKTITECDETMKMGNLFQYFKLCTSVASVSFIKNGHGLAILSLRSLIPDSRRKISYTYMGLCENTDCQDEVCSKAPALKREEVDVSEPPFMCLLTEAPH